jgi:pyruvate/2-oxoglutarate dehydrogenase complex dihydrolipoamide dehydrogenase (E3) component
VPSKALIAAAGRAVAMRSSGPFGIVPVEPTIDFAAVRDHVRGVITGLEPNDSIERLAGLGVRVIAGTARFTGKRTVTVGDMEIKARRFVVATGSSPAIPPIPGLAQTPYLTNETVFELGACPPHLVVLGAGATGLELAQAFRRLGAEATVLEAATPLAKDDPECVAVVLDALRREGIAIRHGVVVERIAGVAGRIAVTIRADGRDETIEGSHVLVAAGRRPCVDGLGLEAARIEVGPAGIVVDRRLKTTNARVYAIGDVIGGHFAHVAAYHADLVIRNALFRLPVRANYTAVPYVTYTQPELAQVGLTEAEARRQGLAIRVLRWTWRDNDRAATERDTTGHIKVLVGPHGRLLGATIVGAHAGELIATWALAIRRRLPVRAMAELVLPYPSLAEVGKRAAIGYYAAAAARPLMRRMLEWLRHLG